MRNKLHTTTSQLAQTTTGSTKLIVLEFLDEKFAVYMLIDGCELIPSSEEKKKKGKGKKDPGRHHAVDNYADQSKQHLIAHKTIIGTDVVFGRFTGISSNKATVQRKSISWQTTLLPVHSSWRYKIQYVPQGVGHMGSGMLQAIHSGTDMLQFK